MGLSGWLHFWSRYSLGDNVLEKKRSQVWFHSLQCESHTLAIVGIPHNMKSFSNWIYWLDPDSVSCRGLFWKQITNVGPGLFCKNLRNIQCQCQRVCNFLLSKIRMNGNCCVVTNTLQVRWWMDGWMDDAWVPSAKESPALNQYWWIICGQHWLSSSLVWKSLHGKKTKQCFCYVKDIKSLELRET